MPRMQYGAYFKVIKQRKDIFTMDEIKEFLASLWAKIGEFASTMGLRIVGAILLLIVGAKFIGWLVKLVKKSKSVDKIPNSAVVVITNLIKIVGYVLLAISIAALLGVPTTSMIAVIGSAGLAIGLALQGSLSNLAGGLMILLFKPFEVDDYIDDGAHSGTVDDIGVFYTTLTTPDNKKIVIPNGALSNSSVTDYSANGTRRLDMKFSVAYSTDIEKTKSVILSVINAHEMIKKEPAPFVRLSEHADSALVFTVRVWVNKENYWTVNFDLNEQVKEAFDKAGIEIPYPQIDVHTRAD